MDYYDILLAKQLNGGGGGGEAVLINKNINANGTYNASSDNADGYKKVVVNVPNPSTGSLSITSNNTYDVTNYASAVVNVPTGITPTGTIPITQNGTVDVTNYASADVNVPSGWTSDGIAENTQPNGAITLSSSSIAQYSFSHKPITEITALNCTSIGSYALENTNITLIDDAHFPAVESFGNYMTRNSELLKVHITGSYRYLVDNVFIDTKKLRVARLPNETGKEGTSVFSNCIQLRIADLGGTQISGSDFNGCALFQKLILRNTSVCALNNANAFSNTPFVGKDGLTAELYVPEDLIASYQSASNWSTILGNGYVTIKKIEGSAYENLNWDDSSFLV